MELSITLSMLKEGVVIDTTKSVEAPIMITEKSVKDFVSTQVSSVGYERLISLSWRPLY